MPNTRMISLTNILNKQFETLGVYNLDMSNKISKLTIEIELNETRDYHIAQYELYHLVAHLLNPVQFSVVLVF